MKQMEYTKKKIGENTFYIKPFGAFPAAYVSAELSKTLAPAIGSLAPIIGGDEELEEGKDFNFDIGKMEMKDVLPVLTNALGSLSGDSFEQLLYLLLVKHKNITIKGEATDGETEILDMDRANEVFCGELQDMLILCVEVIKVNYSGFFKKIAGRFGDLQKSTETQTLPSDTDI